MSTGPEEMLDRVKRIRAAALIAQGADQMAGAAQSWDVEEACWQQFDGAVATILGLILSPEGVVAMDAVEAAIGGRA